MTVKSLLDFAEIDSKLAGREPVWVRLYDGLVICLTEVADGNTYKAKFMPCAKNSREYTIKKSCIKCKEERD